MDFLCELNELKEINLETIIIDYLNEELETKFFDNLKKFKKLRIFAVKKIALSLMSK